MNWVWLTAEHERPPKRFAPAAPAQEQPLHKPVPPVKILPNLTGLRSDEQYNEFLERNKNETAVVNFGSSWCEHCHQMLPHFLALTSAFPSPKYAVAQVDYMSEAARGVTYTPTFAIFKRGRRVDSFYGTNAQQLRDRLWLHSD